MHAATLPEFRPADLALASTRRHDQEEPLRRHETEVIAAFAHLFVNRHVYNLVDPIDRSTCPGVLARVEHSGDGVTLVVHNPDRPQVCRRGPVRVHLSAGLNWATLTCHTRATMLAVHGLPGRETNAAVAYAAAHGLPITRQGDTAPLADIRPGPVLLHGATVFVPGTPYPVFPVAHKLDTTPDAYRALAAASRPEPADFRPAPPPAPTPKPAPAPKPEPAPAATLRSVDAPAGTLQPRAYRFRPAPRR